MVENLFEGDPCSGRPATSRTPENVECVPAVINKDQRLTMQGLAADLGVPQTTVSEILMMALGVKCVDTNSSERFCRVF